MRTGEGPHDAPSTADPLRTGRRLWRSREERQADKAAALVRREQALIEVQRSRDQREMETLEAEREKSTIRGELAGIAQQEQDRAARERSTFRQHISRTAVLASSNVGVNAVAVLGQVLGLTLGLNWPWWAAVPLALVVESVAVNVGYIAHDKLINGYSAGWLRALSYGIGAAVGWFSYTHNHSPLDDGHLPVTAPYAVVFGAASLMSPVLWQIYSQWRHWQELRDRNLLDMQAPKFSRARWVLWLGETFYIVRRAVRHGVSDRAEAVRRFQSEYERTRRRPRKAVKPFPPAADELSRALAQWGRDYRQRGPEVVAVRVQTRDQDATISASSLPTIDVSAPTRSVGSALMRTFMPWTRPDPRPDGATVNGHDLAPAVDADLVAEVDAKPGVDASRTRPDVDGDDDRPEPTDQDKKRVAKWWAKRVEADEVLSKWGLADRTGFKPTWCGDRIAEGKQILARKGWTFDERGRPVRPEEVDAEVDASIGTAEASA